MPLLDDLELQLVIAAKRRKLIRRDLASGNQAATFALRNGMGVDCSADGVLAVVVNTRGATVVVLAVGTLDAVHRGSAGLGEGPRPRFGPGREFVQATWGGALMVRDALTGEVMWREEEPDRRITALACTPDRSLFAYTSAGKDATVVRVRRWPFAAHAAEDFLRRDRDRRVYGLALSGDGRLALRGYDKLTVFTLEGGDELASRAIATGGSGEAVAFSPRGELGCTDGASGARRVIGLDPSRAERWSVDVPFSSDVAYAPSGEYVALGSWERGLVARVSHGV